MWGGHCGEPRECETTEDLALRLAWKVSWKVRSRLSLLYSYILNKLVPFFDNRIFRRGSSSATDLNTTASTSDTGSEWGSGSDDGQEPDVERTTALINGEPFAYHYQRHVTVIMRSLHMMP